MERNITQIYMSGKLAPLSFQKEGSISNASQMAFLQGNLSDTLLSAVRTELIHSLYSYQDTITVKNQVQPPLSSATSSHQLALVRAQAGQMEASTVQSL